MFMRAGLLVIGVLAFGGLRAAAQDSPPCAACAVAIVEPAQREWLPAALDGLLILVRLRPGEETAGAAAVESIARRGGIPGLLLDGLPAAEALAPTDAAPAFVVIRVADAPVDLVAAAFDLKIRMTTLRARLPASVRIGLWAPDAMLQDVLGRDLAPYLDFVVSRLPPGVPVPWWRYAGEASGIGQVLDTGREQAAHSVWLAPQEQDAFVRLLSDLAIAARFLPSGLIPGTTVQMQCVRGQEGRRKEEGARVRVWLDPVTLDHVAWIDDCGPGDLRLTPQPAEQQVVSLSSGDLLVRVPEPSAERFAEGVDVRAPRRLSVEEIIARQQTAAARQAARVRTRISSGTLTLTFEAPGFAAPLAISSEVTIYSDRSRTELEQRSIQVNGVAFAGRGVPRLPLVEPERVASVPLAIELNDAYEYTLQGTDTVEGIACYVVGFEPVAGDSTAFRGRAWIAGDSFALIRIAAAQVRLRGPIVSSEQVDEFEHVAGDVWLLRESRINQIYEGAAHRTPIERVLTLHRHVINPPDFADRRAAAYASDHIMLRDTPEGYRYLRRPRSGDTGVRPGAHMVVIVEEPAARVRTIAAGAIFDPNITHPLPFAGLSYVDFDLFGTGAQFNGFFGGTFGQAAFSVPSLAGTRWQLAGRAFAVASSFNDRAFAEGRELYDRNIRQRPASASVWVLRAVSPRVSIRMGYDLQYTHYARADTTAPEFTLPASQTIHALRVALEGQRAGWNGALWWSPAVRQHWRTWGLPGSGEYDPAHRDFQRFGASLARSAVLSPRLVVRAEGAWMDGTDLDRFSRYSFGAFENPLRGYPGALIRYDRGAVLRSTVAWSVAGMLRLDAFGDSAFVHDPDLGDGLQRFTGFGTAVEVPAPFGTLISAEWGYGIQGRRPDGGRGTHVFRLTGYKVF